MQEDYNVNFVHIVSNCFQNKLSILLYDVVIKIYSMSTY